MAENYCGKNCNECTYKEQLNCPGCENGPGNLWTGNCEIANCCDNKGHKNCETCGHKLNCGSLQRKHVIPKERMAKSEAENATFKRIAYMAPILSKYLPILFWATIITQIAEIFRGDTIQMISPVIYYCASAVVLACGVTYGIVLLLMSSASYWYKTAGIMYFIAPLISFVSVILVSLTQNPLILILSIASIIVALYGKYNEYKGHAEVLKDADPYLSDRWENLWKWTVYIYAAIIASLILAVLIPIIGAITALVSSVAGIIVGILGIYYLYKTAEVFKNSPQFKIKIG